MAKRHSLASSILLDGALALTTLLRITLDPIRRLAVVPALFQPHLRNTTHNRPMIAINRAPKTETMGRVPTRATRHSGNHRRQSALARRSRTRNRVSA
jgi:hypothetical protein